MIKYVTGDILESDAEAIVIGTPIDLKSVIKIDKPSVRVKYDLQEIGKPDLDDVLTEFVKKHKLK